MKYIEAEKLKAKIQKRMEETKSMKPAFDQFWAGQISAFKGAIKIAESLQQEQPEVNLEKEIKHFLSNATKMNKGEWRGKYPISDIGFRAVARHFYELGLNARREEHQ